MPRRSVGGSQLISGGPRRIVIIDTFESRCGVVCDPCVVAYDGLSASIGKSDLDSSDQCCRVNVARRFVPVYDLDSKDVIILIKFNAVFLSLSPIGTRSNLIAINPQSVVIIRSNKNICGDGVWAGFRLGNEIIAEVPNIVIGYDFRIFFPDPIRITEVYRDRTID